MERPGKRARGGGEHGAELLPTCPTPAADGDHTAALPPELLSTIFSHLGIRERFYVASVSKRWRSAALEPPHSTELNLTVWADVSDSEARAALLRPEVDWPGRWALRIPELEGMDGGASAEAAAELIALTPLALSVAEAALVLRHPLSAAARALRLTVLFAASDALEAEGRVPLLAPVLDAAPPSVSSLRVAAPGQPRLRAPRLGFLLGLRSPLRVPGLREISITCFSGHSAMIDAEDLLPPRGPLRVASLSCRSGEALGALANAGVGVRHLSLRGGSDGADGAGRLRIGPAEARAAASLLSPAAGAPPPGARGPSLGLASCALPDAPAWPPDALLGLGQLVVENCPLRPSALDWIVRGAHAASLRALLIADCPLEGVTPPGLLASLSGLREGTRVRIVPRGWPLDSLCEVLNAITASSRLLKDVDVRCEPEATGGALREAFSRYRVVRRWLLSTSSSQ
eukprot:tig00021105_g18243.t1